MERTKTRKYLVKVSAGDNLEEKAKRYQTYKRREFS